MTHTSFWGHRPALLGIDMQVGILRGCGGEDQTAADAALYEMLTRVATVQARCRNLGVPVLHVQHRGGTGHRLDPASDGWEIDPVVAPQGSEVAISKSWCDAFFETDVDRRCRALGIETLIVAGCMTQFCIDTSCRRALSLGYNVVLLGDGHMNAGSPNLSFRQVIDHHNATLAQVDAGSVSLRVHSSIEMLG
ncbi:MAG: isochorismatase family protein [Sphingorhabdus sp.]|uniref:isochorismatase family protein n=1 Tax=Sphingorhabdus sp. TaxID=1902408 RepID=UPI0038FCAAB5